MKKVSIVVPVYKVEKYLDNCVRSIVEQSYNNLEIILVDDGSPDCCPRICDDWQKKDSRIKVIHKSNGGLSDARNSGINAATGDYICFVDSDDYLNKDYVKLLLSAILNNETKIAQCGITYVDENNNYLKDIGYDEDVIISGKNMITDHYGSHDVENVVAWNRLYDISLFKNICFPKGKIHEDEYTTYKLLYYQKSVAIIKDRLYYYRQTTNSIMRSNFSVKRLDIIDGMKERIAFFCEKDEVELYHLSIQKYLAILITLYCKSRKYLQSEKKLHKKITNEFHYYYKKQKKVNNSKYRLFRYFPKLYFFIKSNNY